MITIVSLFAYSVRDTKVKIRDPFPAKSEQSIFIISSLYFWVQISKSKNQNFKFKFQNLTRFVRKRPNFAANFENIVKISKINKKLKTLHITVLELALHDSGLSFFLIKLSFNMAV